MTSISGRRHLAAGVAALLCLFGTVGCDDKDDGDAEKASPSRPTTSGATDEGTEESTSPDETEEAEPQTAKGEEVDVDDFLELVQQALDQGDSARITLKQSASGLDAKGAVSYEDPVAMTMEMSIPALGADAIEARLLDNVMYLKLPQLGGKFIAYDLDDPGNPFGSTFKDLIDPSKLADTIAAGVEKVTFVGEEDVDGESMDHYEVIQDPQATLDDLDLPEGAPVPELPDQVISSFFFDQDGFIRRSVTDLGKLGTSTSTFDDWGVEVVVEKPAPGDVVSAPSAPPA